jgi:hypothetical protein
LRLTVRGCHLRGGRRSRENKCRNGCELLHIGRLRALFPRQEAGQGAAPPTDCRSGSQPGKPSRSRVCSGAVLHDPKGSC